MDEKSEWRRDWRLRWLASIHEFGDHSFQKQHWLDPANTNPHNSFVEYMCCYFDDLDLAQSGYELALRDQFVSPAEVDAISDFHAAADAYKSPADDYDNEAVLNDPKWQELVGLATLAKERLLALLSNPDEIKALNRQF